MHFILVETIVFIDNDFLQRLDEERSFSIITVLTLGLIHLEYENKTLISIRNLQNFT